MTLWTGCPSGLLTVMAWYARHITGVARMNTSKARNTCLKGIINQTVNQIIAYLLKAGCTLWPGAAFGAVDIHHPK